MMQCLRCGREILEGQVFCNDCQKVMERHPVKPHTVVNIPQRSIRDRNLAPKTPRLDDNTELLKRRVRQLRLLVAMLLAFLIFCTGWITWTELRQSKRPAIGQNYTSVIDIPRGGR